jgi:hypothetical protein
MGSYRIPVFLPLPNMHSGIDMLTKKHTEMIQQKKFKHMRQSKRPLQFFLMIVLTLSMGFSACGVTHEDVVHHTNSVAAGTLLPGQQIWKNGVSSYDFGSNDTQEWAGDNVESDPHHIIQSSLKSAGFTLMRSFFFEHSLADNHLMTDAEIDQRLTTISNSGMQCLAVLANLNDVTFNKHLIAYAGKRCSMYEFGNEPDNNGISAQTYVKKWKTQIPQLRAVNPNAKFFGPALAYPAWNTAFMQTFLQGAKASGILPDAVTFHWYPCWQESEASCLTKATSYAGFITQYRNLTRSILGIHVPIGITEWGNDPGSNSNTTYDHDPVFEQHYFTVALQNIIQGGADFANQFDVQSYAGYGTLDMFDINNNDQPKAQFHAMAALIAHYRPGVTQTPTPGT